MEGFFVFFLMDPKKESVGRNAPAAGGSSSEPLKQPQLCASSAPASRRRARPRRRFPVRPFKIKAGADGEPGQESLNGVGMTLQGKSNLFFSFFFLAKLNLNFIKLSY